jgi:anti-anti-sigma factor
MTVEAVQGGRGGVQVLRASGELDIASAPDLAARIPELVEGADGIVLDLSPVTFLDSAGVRLVDRFARECGRREVGFVAVAPKRASARKVLEIVGFGPPLVVDELSAAIAAVSPRTA